MNSLLITGIVVIAVLGLIVWGLIQKAWDLIKIGIVVLVIVAIATFFGLRFFG